MSDTPDPTGHRPRGRLGPGRWVAGYGFGTFRADLFAGLSVAVLIIPQSMAYAHLAGVPPTYGLYASVVPLLVYPLLGTSAHLAIGVIAIDMLILRSGLVGLAEPGTATYLQLAVLVTLMVGVIQIGMGLARMGFLANLLSRPVMVGFTSGAAVLIAAGQITALTGMELEGARVLPRMAWAAARHAGEMRLVPLFFGGASVVILLALRWWKPMVPGPLVVVVLGVLAVVGLRLTAGEVALVGYVPAGLPVAVAPSVDLAAVGSLLPTALTLALVQFVTVISLGKLYAARFRYSVGQNRELLAVGAANVAGSFFRALPVSGSFARTALNVQAGARTPLANAVTAVGVALCLLFLTPVLALVPVPVLGAIVVVAALALLDLPEMRFLLRAKSVDGWIAILTFGGTLLLGILEGVLIGVTASVLAVLYRISHPNTAVLGHVPGTRSFRDLRYSPEARPVEGVLMLRVDASFGFINAEFLKDLLLDGTAETGPDVRAVVLDASSVNDLDTTAARVLVEVKEVLDLRGIDLYVSGVKEPVRRVLARTGATEAIGPDRFFLSPHRAVIRILTRWDASESYLRDIPGGHVDDRSEAAPRPGSPT
jgi:SulP family sulfate permease